MHNVYFVHDDRMKIQYLLTIYMVRRVDPVPKLSLETSYQAFKKVIPSDVDGRSIKRLKM